MSQNLLPLSDSSDHTSLSSRGADQGDRYSRAGQSLRQVIGCSIGAVSHRGECAGFPRYRDAARQLIFR